MPGVICEKDPLWIFANSNNLTASSSTFLVSFQAAAQSGIRFPHRVFSSVVAGLVNLTDSARGTHLVVFNVTTKALFT
jgi:hypothetical protein